MFKMVQGSYEMMHDKFIIRKDFQPEQKVLLHNSRLHLFPEKWKFRWTCPYIVHKVHPHSAVEVHNAMDGTTFQVNGHQLKPYRKYLSLEVEKILLKDHVYQD